MSIQTHATRRSSDLVVLDRSSGFQKFLWQISQAPVLSAEEEYHLATRFQEENDIDASHRLVHSYLRLVLKIARKYLNYHLSLSDLVQEGTIGLLIAVKKFDPKRSNRLSTYAAWWIRAAIHDFILRSWRMVKIATTQIKRRLFFKLRHAKKSLSPLNREEAEELAKRFETSAETILEVDSRMHGADTSLNQPVLNAACEMQDLIADQRPSQEHELLDKQQRELMESMVQRGLEQLSPREHIVVSERFFAERLSTLNEIAQRFDVSRERVRQIEKRALEKLQEFFQTIPEARSLVAEA